MPIILILAALGVWWIVRAVRHSRTTGPPPEHGPVGWTDDARWMTLAPLARAENRRLVRHPVFVTGVLLTPLMLMAATVTDHTSRQQWHRLSPGVALALVPLGWFSIVAANLLVLRPRRAGTAELFASLPAPQPVRTAGALSSIATATTIAALLAVGWVLVLAMWREPIGTPQWAEIGAGVLIVAGAVAVGVGVGRWLPFAALGIVAAVAVTVIQARFLDDTTWPWNPDQAEPVRFLGFLAEPTSVGDPALEIRPAWWHLIYLAALTVIVCAVALSRDGVPRRLGMTLAVGLSVATVAGWMQTRPPSAERVAAMVSYLTDPAEHQTCQDRGNVRYCAYPPSKHLIDEWHARVSGVLALTPATVAQHHLEVTQRIPTTIGNSDCGPQPFLTGLPGQVADRLTPAALWPDDGNVHPDLGNGSFPCSNRDIAGLFTAVQAGAWSIGLPPAPHHDDQRCTADGQARAVLALWLGAAATPGGDDLLRDLTSEGISPNGALTFDDWNNPPMWGVIYTAADAALAAAMLEHPADEIAETLANDWQRWTDPGTTSAELAQRLGLPAPTTSSSSATCP